MKKLDSKNLYQILRTRSVANEIYERFPKVASVLCRRMVYSHRHGIFRLRRSNFKIAVQSACEAATTLKENDSLLELVDLFDYGPLGSEIWAVLNPRNTIENIVTRWNQSCSNLLRESGNSPDVRYGDSEIPEWVEPMPDYADHLGAAGNLFLLSRAIVELRIKVNMSADREWVPISSKNMDFLSNVGEICMDRRATPLFVCPPRRRFDQSLISKLGNDGLGATKEAIDAANGELSRFNIDIEQLKEAIHVVVGEEARRTTCAYQVAH